MRTGTASRNEIYVRFKKPAMIENTFLVQGLLSSTHLLLHQLIMSIMMFKYTLLTVFVCMASVPVSAQLEYSPGTFKITPKREATLQPVSVQVPPEFDHLPQDLTLNLPPGFSVSVFSAHDF